MTYHKLAIQIKRFNMLSYFPLFNVSIKLSFASSFSTLLIKCNEQSNYFHHSSNNYTWQYC